jgi:glycosyltransferase involved in cell wall biosynthesis
MGDHAQPAVTRLIAALGLQTCVSIRPDLSRIAMRNCMQTLDLFILASHQEGLCISALEAMACGVPVVSTRCGGPEEFVLPGETGSLVGFDAQEMARAIEAILENRELRSRLSKGARALIENRYTSNRAESVFTHAFRGAFPDLGSKPYAADLPRATLTANASLG